MFECPKQTNTVLFMVIADYQLDTAFRRRPNTSVASNQLKLYCHIWPRNVPRGLILNSDFSTFNRGRSWLIRCLLIYQICIETTLTLETGTGPQPPIYALGGMYSAFANSCPLQTDTFLFSLIHSHNVILSSNKF